MSVFLLSLVTQTSIADADLVGWWKLDDGSGTTATDSTGNGHDGTLEGNAQWVHGYFVGALQFAGSPDRVVVPYSEQLNPEEAFTVSVWANVEPDSGGLRSAITSRDGSPPRGYIIYAGGNGNWQFVIGTGSGWSTADGSAVEKGEWTHVAATYVPGEQKLYINGELAGEASGTISLNTDKYLSIGAGGTNWPQGHYFFPGLIDDIRIYDRVLTIDELNRLWGEDPAYYYPPDVDAGYYPSIVWQGEPVTVQLHASVYDNDPCDYGILNLQWSKVSGPGNVQFSPANDIEDPCAVLSTPGVYILLLQAWDETPQEGSDVAIIRIKETRPGEVLADDIAAWERLKNLEIPGINVDQHFNIGDTRYVSLTGRDSNAGTIDSPWRTLYKAASSMTADRVVYLREGTYYGPVEIAVKASPIRPAALRGYPGEHVILEYPQSFIDENQSVDHYAPLIKITGSHIEVSNLHLIGARDQLPQSKYSENGISIHGGQSEGCRVLYNEIENVGHCGVKKMHLSGHSLLIEGNYIHDVGQAGYDHGIYSPDDDATIRRNLITNSTGWGIHAYSAPARLEITHNILSGHAQDGIVLGGSDCLVLHNIFYHNTQGGIFFFRRHCRGNIVKNNIFDEPRADFRVDSLGSNDPDEFPQNNLVDYNCFSPGTPRGWFSPYDTYGLNNFTADPRWVDPSNLDFRLTSISPCIDAGEDLGFGSNCGPFYDHVQVIWLAEDFETGDFSIFDWTFSGYASWAVTSEEKNSGTYSARAGEIDDYGSTTLQVRLDCVSGNISFYRRVSSESLSDCLKFYIDGTEKGEWSGEEDWAKVSFPVTAGTRTFEWTYSKDYSIAEGDDTAWIDDIVFPIN